MHNISTKLYGCVLSIGNFDGVHRGHQELLKQLTKEGKARNLNVVIMIFEPQPLELFRSYKPPARLTQLRDKLYYLSQCCLDYVICVRFDHNFASMTAQNFISDLLVKRLGVQFLAVGDDFRFGARRQGDFLFLKKAGIQYGFDVISTNTLCENGARVSSTAIRKALADNRLDIVENLLGHPFSISGRVVHGSALGRIIGFPTANIILRRHVSPVTGVYAVDVLGIDDKPLPGIANIGTCPTVAGVKQQLEVHLLNITVNLYGCYINVILRKKIRNEQRFTSLDELKSQITRDELIARKFFRL